MHEFSTMSQIVSSILEALKDKEFDRVKSVELEIGDLTFLADEQLKFAFKVLSEKNKLDGAELNISHIKAEIKCYACGYLGGMKDLADLEEESCHVCMPMFACPECSGEVEVVKGRECLVKGVELEIDD